MAKRTSRRKKKELRIIEIAVLAAIGLLALLITCFPKLGLPSWSDLFRQTGANQTVDAAKFPFSVHYLDVGQADCELIVCGDECILIDAGDVDAYSTINAYLQAQEIDTIDYFILTHAHADHIGSADEVIRNYTIKNVIMPKYSEENTPTSKVYEDVLYALQDSTAKVIAAKPGNAYTLGGCSFCVYAPNDDYTEMNNSSVVIRAQYGSTSFLFQGDAEKKSESDILEKGFDVRANVLKLGHHGSKTSSTEAYLRAVDPELAIISCGENNSYNLPSDSTLERLDKLGIDYRRTDRNGTIVVTSDGNSVSVQTEK